MEPNRHDRVYLDEIRRCNILGEAPYLATIKSAMRLTADFLGIPRNEMYERCGVSPQNFNGQINRDRAVKTSHKKYLDNFCFS